MLLYHFPLNTQESIENFTNKGFADESLILRAGSITMANQGIVSSQSLYNYTDSFGVIEVILPESWSVSFRFKADTSKVESWMAIFQLFSNLATAGFSGLLYNNGYFQFNAKPIFSFDEKWHSITVQQKTNGNIELYHNGEYVTVYITNTNVYAIGLFGRFYNRPNSAKGYYQDIRIYDYALSQAEINEYSRALVVHYPLQGNELNDSVLKDVSGFGNDAIQSNGSYVTDSPRGEISLYKSGTPQEDRDGSIVSRISTTPKYTISFWIKTNHSVTNVSNIIVKFRQSNWGGNSAILYYEAQNNVNRFVWGVPNSNNVWDTLYINFNESELKKWNLLTLTYDGTSKKFYINGVLGTEKQAEIYSNYLDYVCLLTYNDWFLSDYRVYATALSAEDIKNLYNSPISVSNQHQTMAFELNENPLYPSKYWRTPTYAEMNYILNTRTNAANLRTLGRVEISSGTYRNGLFLLPDGFTAPSGITVTITTANYTTNSYTLAQFKQLESVGAVIMPLSMYRNGTNCYYVSHKDYFFQLGSLNSNDRVYDVSLMSNNVILHDSPRFGGGACRLIHNGTHFSTSATTKIDFAPANLQYHCTQHIWRFAEHSYDIIGADNANISDSYNGWIDLFGYGTSGVNYSPTLHTTNSADYASGGISNTDNDWGINEIQSYDYNMKNFAANKNGIVQHNELRENDSDVNGCYNDKLITNELIEN